MIPHHHHSDEKSAIKINNEHQHNHDKSSSHHHHDAVNQHHHQKNDTNKENHKSVPFHHHVNSEYDFDFRRVELNKTIITYIPLVVFKSINYSKITASEDKELITYSDIPFKIKTTFEPGVSGLRAPPAIA